MLLVRGTRALNAKAYGLMVRVAFGAVTIHQEEKEDGRRDEEERENKCP